MKKIPRKAVTLVEIMIAIVILALSVLPVIGTFSQYYGVATRQLDQETALKISEATMNKLLSQNYKDLVNNAAFSLPLNFQTPTGGFIGNMNFAGGNGSSGPIKLGKLTYKLDASIEKVFVAQDILAPHPLALEFKYGVDPSLLPPPDPPPPGPPPLAGIATYSSTDDLILIKLTVNYGGQAHNVEISAFRADMSK